MTALQWNNLLPDPLAFCFDPRHRRVSLGPITFWAGLFPGSSVVEQLTVNQLVGGSNPSRGAIFSY
jgi:hypothetical protein